MRDLPNILTLLRIGLIPLLIISFYLEGLIGHWVAAIIFTFASITDYFDGMLARALNAHSSFGRMFDPIADKLLVASALMMLVHFERAPIIPAILILCREITVSGLREYLAEFKVSIPVSNLSKVKTAIQFISVTILLLGERAIGIPYLDLIGEISLWIAAILTLVTGYAYLKEGINKTSF
jgi:cardiolipin synthase